MKKRTREILALILLVVLGLAAVCAMAWYILVGHNWNQAATHIDDMVGSMDGYTVIVYEGVVKKPKEDSSSTSAAKSGKTSSGSESDSKATSASATPSDSADSSGSPSSSSESAASSESPSSSSDSATSSDSQSSSSDSAEAADVFDVDAVASSYREKGATVIKINSDDMRLYEDPMIVGKNGKRYGIFSFTGKYRYRFPLFRSSIRYLQKHATEYVVALATDKAMLKGRLLGVDLLVLLRDAGIREGGENRGQTLCVDSPYIGEVQAIIISPSGVMTSRTIKGL